MIDGVLRRSVVSCVASAALLIALAVPALSLTVSKPSNDALASQDEPALATLARVRADFPSTSAPALVVVTGPAEQQAQARRAVRRLTELAEGRGIAHPPFQITGSEDGTAGSVELPLTGAGDNDASRHAVEVLR